MFPTSNGSAPSWSGPVLPDPTQRTADDPVVMPSAIDHELACAPEPPPHPDSEPGARPVLEFPSRRAEPPSTGDAHGHLSLRASVQVNEPPRPAFHAAAPTHNLAGPSSFDRTWRRHRHFVLPLLRQSLHCAAGRARQTTPMVPASRATRWSTGAPTPVSCPRSLSGGRRRSGVGVGSGCCSWCVHDHGDADETDDRADDVHRSGRNLSTTMPQAKDPATKMPP